jgi:hypothetical protein
VRSRYGAGELAVLHTSMLCALPNAAFITGDKGRIHLQAVGGAWHCCQKLSYKLECDAEEVVLDFTDPRRADQFEFKFINSQLMKYECSEVNECIRSGAVESKIHSLEESLAIMQTMDTVRAQLGVEYEADRK